MLPPVDLDLSLGPDHVTKFLRAIGEDPCRGGLLDTPRRFLEAWQYWTSGYREDPGDILKTFEDGAENYDQMVVQGAIPLWSHCEHHLSPFFGVAHIGYIPSEKRIVGLSKLSRVVDIFARRLQVQERLTRQIADALNQHLRPRAVGVVLRCRHTCIESRGVRKSGSSTYTSALIGEFKDEPAARSEFMQFVRAADGPAQV